MDLAGPIARGLYRCARALPQRSCQRDRIQRQLHGTFSVDLLFSEHSFAGRSPGALFYRNAVSRIESIGRLAHSWLEDSVGGSSEAGAPRRRVLRAVALLSRVRSGFLFAC